VEQCIFCGKYGALVDDVCKNCWEDFEDNPMDDIFEELALGQGKEPWHIRRFYDTH